MKSGMPQRLLLKSIRNKNKVMKKLTEYLDYEHK